MSTPLIRWVNAIVVGTGIIGLGVGLLKYTTPTDEQFYNSLSPELKKIVDDRKKDEDRRNEELEKLKASALADKPIWADSSNNKK